jgi:GntR family transcriptional regulator
MNKIDKTSSTPYYKQLRLMLQDYILLGDWNPGYLLPTEQDLCDTYGISRITARKALDDLAQAGFIERIQGKGSIVKDRRKNAIPQVQGFTESTNSSGRKARTELIGKELVYGLSDINQILELDEDEPLWSYRRIGYVNDVPAVLMNHYVSQKLGDKMNEYDLRGKSFFSMYEKILKSPITSLENVVVAVNASAEMAKILGIAEHSAQMWFRGIAYIEGDIPVEVNNSIFRADYYEFKTTLFRPRREEVGQI